VLAPVGRVSHCTPLPRYASIGSIAENHDVIHKTESTQLITTPHERGTEPKFGEVLTRILRYECGQTGRYTDKQTVGQTCSSQYSVLPLGEVGLINEPRKEWQSTWYFWNMLQRSQRSSPADSESAVPSVR